MATTQQSVRRLPAGLSNEALGIMLGGVKEDVAEMSHKLDALTGAVSTLSRIEERQIGVVDEMGKMNAANVAIEARLRPIEVAMPGLVEVRRWVMAGMVAGIGMMFVAVASLVLYPRPPAYIVSSPATINNRIAEDSFPPVPSASQPSTPATRIPIPPVSNASPK